VETLGDTAHFQLFSIAFFISEQSRQSASKSSKAVGADPSKKKQLNPVRAEQFRKKASTTAMPLCLLVEFIDS